MAEVEANDDDVFEIDDFTVVSPLETLISAIEVAIHEYGLEGARPDFDTQNLQLEITERSISYESNTFILRWCRPRVPEAAEEKKKAIEDEDDEMAAVFGAMRIEKEEAAKAVSHFSAASRQIASSSFEFTSQSNICAMFGVAEYLLMTGVHSTNDRIATHEQKDFVLSAVRVALNNTNCEVPFFVMCGPAERELFFGASETKLQSITFLPSHVHIMSPRHCNLTGLISFMKEKVNTKGSVVDLEEVRAAVRFEYKFHERQRPRTMYKGTEKIFIKDCRDCRDNLNITLVCRWPCQPETRLHENESFTNLEPADATYWNLFADFSPLYQPISNRLKCAIGHSLNDSSPLVNELFTLPPAPSKEDKNVKDELMDFTTKMGEHDWRNLLGDDILDVVDENDKKFPEWTKASFLDPNSTADPLVSSCLEELRTCKGAPPRSIASRLAVQISHVVDDEADIAVKWTAFSRLLRWHWDTNTQLPGMASIDAPNLGTCLLNQKLEMLNCCIRARSKRHAHFESLKQFQGNDEFFDAEEDLSEDGVTVSENDQKLPQGRLERLEPLTLFHHPEVPLFVPVTQMESPMTEDMAAAHVEHILSLKDAEERTEAQLGLLRSDMQAFKAANPQCDQVDFIRWHSPKDFDEETGELSERMRLPDNAWERCWREAPAVAAIHQKPHFNETAVAEGILSMFEGATIGRVSEWILPLLFHYAALQLIFKEEAVREQGEAKTLCTLVTKALWNTNDPAKAAFYQALHHIRKYERLAHFHSHLWKTFLSVSFVGKKDKERELRDLISAIMKESDAERNEEAMFRHGVPVPGAGQHYLADVIAGDFQGRNGHLTKNQIPSRKSYVLYWNAPSSGVTSRLQPQRTFANIEYDNNRVCTATACDAVFF